MMLSPAIRAPEIGNLVSANSRGVDRGGRTRRRLARRGADSQSMRSRPTRQMVRPSSPLCPVVTGLTERLTWTASIGERSTTIPPSQHAKLVITEAEKTMCADDIQAIHQLAARYADAMNRGDLEAAVQTYAPAGALETSTSKPALGWAAISEVIAAKMATLELIFQTVHVGVVVVSGDSAHTRFPISEWSRRSEDDQPFLLLGWYADEVIRLDCGWRFSRRRLVPRTVAKTGFMNGPLLPTSGLTADP
jgi:ketosteroid isomerase-like protein